MSETTCIVGQWTLVENQLVWTWTIENAPAHAPSKIHRSEDLLITVQKSAA
jgi:hypothetical protein